MTIYLLSYLFGVINVVDYFRDSKLRYEFYRSLIIFMFV